MVRLPRRLEQLPCCRDDGVDLVGAKHIAGDSPEDFAVEFFHRPLLHVRADLRPLVVMRRTRIEERPTPVLPMTAGMHAAAADAAPAEAGEEILRILITPILPSPVSLALVLDARRA